MFASTGMLALTFLAGTAVALHSPHAADGQDQVFDAFITKFGRTYSLGSEEYEMRRGLFAKKVVEIEALNSRPGRKWMSGVNDLSDYTPAELQRLMGYRHHQSTSHSVLAAFRRAPRVFTDDVKELPAQFDWRKFHLTSLGEMQNQGACGSCWALGASTVLRCHMQLHSKFMRNSIQQIVACTPNPNHCGGLGGCEGATAELAFDHVLRAGVLTEDELPYRGTDDNCPAAVKNELLKHTGESEVFGGKTIGMTGYGRLPENKVEPLLLAVYHMGPVAVSLAAGIFFSMYNDGIFDECDSWVINHSVVMAGFGADFAGHKYYLIQNSWGESWGENGYIRIGRKQEDADETQHCGWDNEPSAGSACTGGPTRIWACGSCGILYHTIIPIFAGSQGAWNYINGRGPKPVVPLVQNISSTIKY